MSRALLHICQGTTHESVHGHMHEVPCEGLIRAGDGCASLKSKASDIQIRARDVAVSVHDCNQEAQHRAFSRQVTGTRASLFLGLLAPTPICGQRPQETAHSG